MSIGWICTRCHSRAINPCNVFRAVSARRTLSGLARFFKVSEEVQQAIAEKRPVVALETTIYTHGYPYPENLALASQLESLVRSSGGVPATIGILDGIARVGLGQDELTRLVSNDASRTMKISRRDLGFALGLRDASRQPFNGGTTIAGTMILAHMAGIRIFATGGLGGVHRGAETTMDISADLTELGRTPVAVISSGCKAFLDLPKTLEYLETQGVAVATFSDGRSADKVDFPAFFTRESGVPSPMTLKDEVQAAQVIDAHFSLGLQSGLHFANPIPERHSLSKDVTEAAIYEAVKHADITGAVGAAATPYILSKIKEFTGDESVKANKALVEANVIRGTKVAVELQKLEANTEKGPNTGEVRQSPGFDPTTSSDSISHHISAGTEQVESSHPTSQALEAKQRGPEPDTILERPANVFVAGSLAIDLSCAYKSMSGQAAGAVNLEPALHTSNPATITQSLGGVGSNVARAANLMGATVRLLSAVGDDLGGKAALEALRSMDLSTAGISVLENHTGARTAQYVAVNDGKNDLLLAMADMSILEPAEDLPPVTGDLGTAIEQVWLPRMKSDKPSHLVIDGNWSPNYLARWLEAGRDNNAHVAFEPVSKAKSTRLFHLPKAFELAVHPKPSVQLATPNQYELGSMYTAARERGFFDRKDWWGVIDALGISHAGARVQLTLATSAELVDQGIPQQSIQLLPFIPSICTKLGSQGVLLTQLIPANDERLSSAEYAPYILSRCANGTEDTLGVGGVYMRLFPAAEEVAPNEVVSVNGVGDTFVGTLIAGLANRKGARAEELIDLAQRAAVLTLKSSESVSPGLGTLRILM